MADGGKSRRKEGYIFEPICYSCMWLGTWPHCAAYPERNGKGIPQDIRDGEWHNEPRGDEAYFMKPDYPYVYVPSTDMEREMDRQTAYMRKVIDSGEKESG